VSDARQFAYQRALGESWAVIPDVTRQLHSPDPVVVFEGRADISRSRNPLAGLAADLMGLPRAGMDVPARITVTRSANGETLKRDYGGRVFETHQQVRQDGAQIVLIETIGPFRFHFRLTGHEDGIDFHLLRAHLWGLPLPGWLAPRMRACERADGNAHIFDVASALPLIGEIVSYRGRLVRIA
jgi:hypothetical protein